MTPSPLGFDCETHLIVRGRLAPRMVCLTLAGHGALPWWVGACADLVRRTPGRWSALLDRSATVHALPHLLAYEGLLVAHNAPFDLAVLTELAGESVLRQIFERLEAGTIADTGVREKLIRLAQGEFEFSAGPESMIRTRYDLAGLVKRYFGDGAIDEGKKSKTKALNPGDPLPEAATTTNPTEPWRLRYWQLDGVPVRDWPEAAVRYAIDDAVWAVDVYRAQAAVGPQRVDDLPLWEGDRVVSESRELRAAWALHLEATWGLRCDPVAVESTVAAWSAVAEEGRRVGEELGFVRVKGRDKGKPGSIVKKKLQAAVAAACLAGGALPSMTGRTKTFPNGQIRYGEDQLREAADAMASALEADPADHPLMKYAETRTFSGYDTKYSNILRMGAEWPVTSSPNHLVATGRTSWRNPPFQQPPKSGGFREAFVPSPGHYFVSVDYDTIELCALAQCHIWLGLGDTMARAIRADQDLHVKMATEILKLEGADTPPNSGPVAWTYGLAAACRAGEYGAEWATTLDRYRQLAKIANFGFPGGQGPKSLALNAKKAGVILTEEQAERLRYAWRATWPEMGGYFELVSRRTMLGSFTAQQAVSGRLRGDCGYTDGCNTYFQGLVADGAKHAAWLLAREAYTGTGPFAGSRPVLFLHDEIVAEVPIETAHEAAWAMTSIMVTAMGAHIPDVPIRALPALMARWYKKAKHVTDESGRLALWSPDGG